MTAETVNGERPTLRIEVGTKSLRLLFSLGGGLKLRRSKSGADSFFMGVGR